jgi:hypothetical protein
MFAWLYRGIDGTEWVIRATDLVAAQAAAHCAEKRRTGSIAAGLVAARSVARY